MNKAAFLDILNHVTSISEQEVIELEKLALNFPYCQSAHLLLAKAAYDKGSMLSNQRLRRAAACAANRQLLKKLIYTAGHHLVLEPIAEDTREESLPAAPLLSPQIAELPEGFVEQVPQTENLSPQEGILPEGAIDQGPQSEDHPAQETAPAEIPAPPALMLEPIEPEALDVEEYDAALVPASVDEKDTEAPAVLQAADQETLLPEEPEAIPLESEHQNAERQIDGLSETDTPGLEPIELEPLELESFPLSLASFTQPEPQPETELVRDDETASGQQQEAHQLQQGLPEIYEIPELLDDADIAAAAAAALAPENLEAATETNIGTEPAQKEPVIPALAPVYFADDLDDLFRVDFLASVMASTDPVTSFVNSLPAEEENLDTVALAEAGTAREAAADEAPALSAGKAAAESPADLPADDTLERFDSFLFSPEQDKAPAEAATGVVPFQEEIIYKVFDANELGYWMDSSRLGETLLLKNELATNQPYYFRPELLLEYSRHNEMATYQAPEPSILARQFDIIDQFLKLNPKIKSMAQVKIKAESQEDLSLKSTKIRKNTASETLATILVQQGKIRKAIKIYEHLMLKLPEKKDYFASQIEKLQKIN